MPPAAALLHQTAMAQGLQALRGVGLAPEEVREGGEGGGQVSQDDGLALGAGHSATAALSMSARASAVVP